MEKHLGILRKCPLFETIGDSELLRMLVCLGAKIKTYDKNSTIFDVGSSIKHIGIVLSGLAQIIQIDYCGNRSILSNVAPSEIFGEAFACAESTLPVSIVESEPCEIMLIECSHITHTCENGCGFHNQLIYNLMKDLAKKNVTSYQKIEVTSKRRTREKLLTYLAICARENGKSSFYIPFDRQELADYLEVERSGLSSEIAKMQREGILKSRKNHFVILNLQ